MVYAYTRVSSVGQNLDRQVVELNKHYKIDKMFQEKKSGKNMLRPELQTMLSLLVENDTVVILELSRLARSLQDLLQLVKIFQQKNIIFIVHKENFDITTPMGKMFLTIISSYNEFQRETILERQAQGIAIAKRNGVYKKSNKPKYIDENALLDYVDLIEKKEITKKEVALRLGISTVTLWKRLNQLEEAKLKI